MNLHRTTGCADWEKTAPQDRNQWQRLAAATNGIVTPGNVVTILGLALIVGGLVAIGMHHFWLGGTGLVIGRLCDVVDGWLAEKTGTKGPFGEFLDAAIDKLGTGLTIIVFFLASVAPWWLLMLLILPHIIIPVIVFVKRQYQQKIHPSRIGKLSMAAAWMGLLGLVLIAALSARWPETIVVVVYVTALASVAMGLYAAAGYVLGRD